MPQVIRFGYVDSEYGQLHYRIARPDGPAKYPPLLLLHQSPRSGWEWEPIMPGLARERIVLAPDTPGYGASTPPPAPIGIPDFARVMARFMDEMKAQGVIEGDQFDVCGYHTGSVTATELARSRPDRVRRVVPFGLAAYDAPARAEKLENISVYPTPTAPDISHIARLWDRMATMVDRRASPQWRHAALAQGLINGQRLPWGFMAVYKHDFIAAMAEVKQPVLIINLEDDLFAVTSQNAYRYANGREVKVMGASHGVLAIETDRIVHLITDFLNADDPLTADLRTGA